MYRRTLTALLFVLAALLGCGGGRSVELLSLESVEPRLIEPGTTLRVLGSGLPVGRDCRVELTGKLARPGAPPLSVRASAGGRAVAENAVELQLGEAELAALGDHGSFRGELQLAFEGHRGGARITGRLPVQIDLVQPMARGAAHRHALRRRARAALRHLGIVPQEEAATVAGLTIDWARHGSVAERAGLRHGDVIERAGGVAIHTLGDLAPPPGAPALSLSVRRPPTHAAQPVSLSLAGLDGPAPDVGLGRLSVLLAFVFACLLMFSPLPSPAQWLARCVSRVRQAPPPELGLWGGSLALRPQPVSLSGRLLRGVRRLSWPLSISLGAALLVWLEPAGLLRLRSASVYLAFAAVSITLTMMSDSGSRRERLRAAAEVGFRIAVMAAVLLCACALSGTRTFDGMVAEQGAWPHQWGLFRKPPLLLSFPLYVVYAARLGAATLALDGPGHVSRLLVLERVLTNLVLCSVGAAIFLGGWQTPPDLYLELVPVRLVGGLLFVLKCWALAAVLSVARRIGLGEALRTSTTVATSLAIVALTALWLWLDPAVAMELALGRAALAALVIVTLASGLQVALAVRPMGITPRSARPFELS
ncbi:MAG: hypothetical protein PVI30_09945 [Myxococcales bacterium]